MMALMNKSMDKSIASLKIEYSEGKEWASTMVKRGTNRKWQKR